MRSRQQHDALTASFFCIAAFATVAESASNLCGRGIMPTK